ncbi:MAG: PD-(D/E)XK nuclease family protein [Acidobacteriia bacterium]|nr:PD-(D/E)XK nuclease family protein [Terriglobia bacterium]
MPDALPPSAWAHLFAQRLQNFGWLTGPLGNRRKTDLLAANLGPVSPWDSVAQRAHFALLLDNDEAQAVDAWRDALTHMSSLDLVSSELTAFDALSLLRRIVGDTPFTGEDLGQPVHLMSISEAAGSDFDHLWIMGLHEDAWPAPPSPTPFLPITLQAAHKVPGCTPRSQLDQAAGLTRRLLASAGHIVVSYPMMLAERPLGPSPLLGNARKTEPAPQPFALVAPLSAGASAGAGYTHWYLQPAELESLLDIRAPLLPEGSIAPGGARTLEMQAACPFRAFAEMRLGARPLESPDLGLDPRQRGKLIHKAMELFWHRLRSQDNLRQLAPAQLDSLVEDSVKESLRFTRLPGGLFHDKLKDLEISRLSAMVHEWLALERERAPFTVVASEQKRDIALAGLHLSTRVDRVDQLPDGSHVLIDYKTNAPSPDAWDGRRPDQPQLPLYALTFQERGGQERAGQEHAGTTELRLRESLQVPSTHGGPAGPAPAFDAPLAAVAFAQMRTGDMRFRGRASQDGLLPGVDAVDSFEQLPRDWRTVLEKLATNYRDGHAEVDPKFESTCDFCHLHSLCRIHE